MTFSSADRVLLNVAFAHLALALCCALALLVPAAPILGVHPALKPLKFALSIAAFLGTMAVLLPMLEVSLAARRAISLTLSAAMVVEIVPIVLQPLRGTTSHFNTGEPFSAVLWSSMVLSIVIATVVMAMVACLASVKPLATDPLLALAWRAGLWLFMLSAVSGFAMGGRLKHSVGGDDGGPGLPFVNWSTRVGDLRVAHFFALHALQSLPLMAWVLRSVGLSEAHASVLIWLLIAAHLALCMFTLAQSFAGRPLW